MAGKLCAPVTTLIGLRWIIRNTEYLQKDQACIVVSNHQSSLDILGKLKGGAVWVVCVRVKLTMVGLCRYVSILAYNG